MFETTFFFARAMRGHAWVWTAMRELFTLTNLYKVVATGSKHRDKDARFPHALQSMATNPGHNFTYVTWEAHRAGQAWGHACPHAAPCVAMRGHAWPCVATRGKSKNCCFVHKKPSKTHPWPPVAPPMRGHAWRHAWPCTAPCMAPHVAVKRAMGDHA